MYATRTIFISKIIILLCAVNTCFAKICPADATCVQIRKCHPYTSLLKEMHKPLRPIVVNFLRSQECGFKNGFPKVCCSAAPGYLHYLQIFKKKDYRVIKDLDQLKPEVEENTIFHLKKIGTTTILPDRTKIQLKVTTESILGNNVIIKEFGFPRRLFNITVATAPPGATPVPYIKALQEKNDFEEFPSEYALYDLFRQFRY